MARPINNDINNLGTYPSYLRPGKSNCGNLFSYKMTNRNTTQNEARVHGSFSQVGPSNTPLAATNNLLTVVSMLCLL